jgi:hypothetical protein
MGGAKYAIDLPSLPGEPKPPPGSEGGPGASESLYVFGEVGGAEDELKACQDAGGLICFRPRTSWSSSTRKAVLSRHSA